MATKTAATEENTPRRGKVGAFIKKRRDELGITQAELSKRVGYQHHNFLVALEQGRSRFPLDKWKDFAAALEVPKPEFLKMVLEEQYPDLMDYIVGFYDPDE